MNKPFSYVVEVKGYSSNETQRNYNRLSKGAEIYIDEKLQVRDSRKRLLGNITQKYIKENGLTLITSYPSYFECRVARFSHSKTGNKILHMSIQVKEEYAYYFFKNSPENEGKLYDFFHVFKKGSTVYTNYGPATFISANIENKVKYFIVDIPSIGQKKIYDIYSVEI